MYFQKSLHTKSLMHDVMYYFNDCCTAIQYSKYNQIYVYFTGHNKKPKKTKLPLHELMKVSEVIYESSQPIQINQESNTSQTKTRMYFPSMKNNEVPFDSILPKNNVDDNVNNLPIEPTLQPFIDHSETH